MRQLSEILADLNAAQVNAAYQTPMAEKDRAALLALTVEAIEAGAAALEALRAQVEALTPSA